jgi:hypothetical protein
MKKTPLDIIRLEISKEYRNSEVNYPTSKEGWAS